MITFSKTLEIMGKTEIVLMAPAEGKTVFSLESGIVLAAIKYLGECLFTIHLLNTVLSLLLSITEAFFSFK